MEAAVSGWRLSLGYGEAEAFLGGDDVVLVGGGRVAVELDTADRAVWHTLS